MFYLLWFTLNVFLAIYFLYLAFKATRLVSQKFGWFASLFLVFIFFSFMCRPNREDESEKSRDKWHWENGKKDDSLAFRNKEFKRITLDRNLMFKINLGITYYKDASGKIVPVSSYLTKEGVFGGYNWRAENLSLNAGTDGKNIEYNTSGTFEISILNLPVYFNHKNYTGTISIK